MAFPYILTLLKFTIVLYNFVFMIILWGSETFCWTFRLHYRMFLTVNSELGDIRFMCNWWMLRAANVLAWSLFVRMLHAISSISVYLYICYLPQKSVHILLAGVQVKIVPVCCTTKPLLYPMLSAYSMYVKPFINLPAYYAFNLEKTISQSKSCHKCTTPHSPNHTLAHYAYGYWRIMWFLTKTIQITHIKLLVSAMNWLTAAIFGYLATNYLMRTHHYNGLSLISSFIMEAPNVVWVALIR